MLFYVIILFYGETGKLQISRVLGNDEIKGAPEINDIIFQKYRDWLNF